MARIISLHHHKVQLKMKRCMLVLACAVIFSLASERYTVNVPANNWATIRNAAGEYVLGKWLLVTFDLKLSSLSF
jgi:hypothetical protein